MPLQNPEDDRFADIDWSALVDGAEGWDGFLDQVIEACDGS